MNEVSKTAAAIDKFVFSPAKKIIKETPPVFLKSASYFFLTQAFSGQKIGLPDNTISNAVILGMVFGIGSIEAKNIINGDSKAFDFSDFVRNEYPLLMGAFSGLMFAGGSIKNGCLFGLASVAFNKLESLGVDEKKGLLNWSGASREVGTVLSSSLAVLTGFSLCVNRPLEAAVCGIGAAAVRQSLCVDKVPSSEEPLGEAQEESFSESYAPPADDDMSSNGRRHVGSNICNFGKTNALLLPAGDNAKELTHPSSNKYVSGMKFLFKKNQR